MEPCPSCYSLLSESRDAFVSGPPIKLLRAFRGSSSHTDAGELGGVEGWFSGAGEPAWRSRACFSLVVMLSALMTSEKVLDFSPFSGAICRVLLLAP